jgi:hypothetical protein
VLALVVVVVLVIDLGKRLERLDYAEDEEGD